MNQTCAIIGMLDNGLDSLTEPAKATILTADLVIGGARLLELVKPALRPDTQTFDLASKLGEVAPLVQKTLAQNQQVAVLASGDPLFYGIGNYLIKQIGEEQITIFSQVSSVQLACTKLGLSLQNLKVCSVHTADLGEWDPSSPGVHGLSPLLTQIHSHDQLAVLTSPNNSPARIARMLMVEEAADQFRWSVCESLNGATEKIHRPLTTAQVAEMEFSEPNLVVLERIKARQVAPRLGREDQEYKQRKPDQGLITKREVRLVSLGLLGIGPKDVIWDIGSGSGAVGIEAAAQCPFGHVYGVEKNLADFEIASANKQTFGAYNLHLTHAKAPEGMMPWPRPNGVFLGGTGGNLELLMTSAWAQLLPHGRMVLNLISIENQTVALNWFKQQEVPWEMTQLQVSNAKPILDMHRLKASNPVTILFATKPTDD